MTICKACDNGPCTPDHLKAAGYSNCKKDPDFKEQDIESR